MKKRSIKNSELDAAAAKLLKAGSLSCEEIDGIVSSPRLFASIRARIAVGEPKPVSQSKWFAWKPAAAAMAAIAVLIISFGYFGYFNGPATAAFITSPKPPTVFTVTEETAKQDFRDSVAITAPFRTGRPTATKAVYRELIKPAKPKRPQSAPKNEGEFYALNFAGSIEDAMRGGHIVRADLPRSSLFALGVNLPLENDAKFIRTDLLVGTDGVPRAIRFVE